MNNLLDKARSIPVPEPVLTISYSPVTLPTPGRAVPLELRITAPAAGGDLPILLLSHGDGPSLYLPSKDGYAPLANFYAEHGFAVIQPTHGNSKVAGFGRSGPDAPLFWRSRVHDMKTIIDRLGDIEVLAPALAKRLDHGRIAAVGHSMGGQTVGMLLGARLTDPKDPDATGVDVVEPRIKTGVLLAAPGRGGDDLSDYARENFSFMNPDYRHLLTRTLVVVGDADINPFITVRGPEWYTAAFQDGPGADCLLTLFGAKHGLGGVAGYDAKETNDEDPDRLEATRRMTWAYLRSALYKGDPAWADACKALEGPSSNLGRVTCKQA